MGQIQETVEDKIVGAAIECLERYGVQGTTNRKIAEIAGINSAAINYYFRSKEILIQRAMEKSLDNAFDWQDFGSLPGNTPQERCEAIFTNLIIGGINYPGVTRAHFYDLLTSGDYDSLVVKRLNDFVYQLCDDLQKRGLNKNRAELEMACTQVASAVFMMILTPQLFLSRFGLDMRDESTRSRFVKSLVKKIL